VKIENLDHLGLVAGVIDELGLVELTDEQIKPHCLENVSAGQVLKAMILNALGFFERSIVPIERIF
jgi:hypothetical protein